MPKRNPLPRGRPPHNDVLTPAEWNIVHGVKHGLSNREIAIRRGISPDAVKFHVGNALAKLGFSNRQQLRKWFRIPRGSALDGRRIDMQSSYLQGSIAQISRGVGDVQRAETWYRSVLGLKHLYTFGKLAFFDCAGVRLLLQEAGADLAADPMLYLRVTDIGRAYTELQARGVEFINAPHLVHRHLDGTEEWMAFFKDPDERPLAIMSQVESEVSA
jgi:DNA-binding CsgD family transcriptional regulator/catechol 2,3-dioxygenase-like lactoylglutathione lyase family enzyme